MNQKVSLVTGGAGFIGSHLVDRLLHLGHKVIVIDNESSDGHDKYYWNHKAKNYKYDICDFAKIVPLFAGVDYVFHTAAKVSVQESFEDPIPTFTVNALGTANVLEASRISQIKSFVMSSTSAVYGNSNQIPSLEGMREDPLNTYSIGKLASEHLCRSYNQLYGLKTLIFRYSNVYGERSRHTGSYAPVVSKFINSKKEQEPLTIYGSGYQRRDFIHVSDVVTANALVTYQNIEQWGEVYNIGFGKNWSVQEIADHLYEDQIHLEGRPGEMSETLLDISKAWVDLNWKPKVNMMDWIRTQL